MPLHSINPATGETLATFPELSEREVTEKIIQAEATFHMWRRLSWNERREKFLRLSRLLTEQKQDLGKLITLEMGKPIRESKAEIEKCAWCCEYFAENAEKFLTPEQVETDASESFVTFDPLGIILAVMPWNFPFWQVIRFIAPAAMAGNVGILKHASGVPQCSLALERVFLEAGFPEGVLQSLLISSEKVPGVIADPRVKAVTLTGSEYAGSQVAEEAGKNLKKTVLELGGSNPFVVLEDADLDLVIAQAVRGRFQNTGQSCIAAKRFVIVEKIASRFLEGFKKTTESLVIGDPLDEKTEVGPLSGEHILKGIEYQVEKSVALGAEILTGGERWGEKGYYYRPTILTKVAKGMPAYDEETFGPVAAVTVVKDTKEAVEVANDTPYGLGASLFTKDLQLAKSLIPEFVTSTVFINGIVKSDPRLPFGGIGRSGYGRELSAYGIKEFMNVKTVWIL